MKTTIEFLDAVKEKLGIESDYGLAKRLGFPLSTMSNYRTGRRVLDDDAALTVALALDVHPFNVIAAINVERAKTPETRARWMNVIEGFLSLLPHAKSVRSIALPR